MVKTPKQAAFYINSDLKLMLVVFALIFIIRGDPFNIKISCILNWKIKSKMSVHHINQV